MSHLQQLELLEQTRDALKNDHLGLAVTLLDQLERRIKHADEVAERGRSKIIWGRCWVSETSAGPRPVWVPLEDEIEVATLVSGDPDNLDRLCSNMVLAAEQLLDEQPPEIQVVRVRCMLSTHSTAGRAHNLTLDYVARQQRKKWRKMSAADRWANDVLATVKLSEDDPGEHSSDAEVA